MTSVTQSFPGFLMDEGNTHVVLVDVGEDNPTRVLLTITTAVEGKPLAHIKLTPHIALHVANLLKEGAAKAWAARGESLGRPRRKPGPPAAKAWAARGVADANMITAPQPEIAKETK